MVEEPTLCSPSSSPPATTYAGMFWQQSDTNLTFVMNGANTAWVLQPFTLLSSITTSQCNAANSETVLSSCTFTVPANFLVAGRTIRIRFYGVHTSSSTPTNPRFRVRLGGSTGTILLDSGVITAIASQTNCLLIYEGLITCLSAGSSGTVEAQGSIQFNPAAAATPPLRIYAMNSAATVGTTVGNSAAVTVNTTVQSDLVFTCFFSSTTAGNTVTVRSGTVEVIA
jgi:hypothetical protein